MFHRFPFMLWGTAALPGQATLLFSVKPIQQFLFLHTVDIRSYLLLCFLALAKSIKKRIKES
ncbi:hypothetical protein DNTS_008441 [Danionella cerebrum]|uniref:Uncharacterized protein n=1 Tax=Danionella cerebrum TaxID=2873325 RepID=A0A553QXP6_9TELE|nr:hypothetical protein DNTS_008441 [Danionella translucida]